jgi:hypothetical protein
MNKFVRTRHFRWIEKKRVDLVAKLFIVVFPVGKEKCNVEISMIEKRMNYFIGI